MVSWLTEALVSEGHEVTLFASGDSRTSARLCAVTRQSIRLNRKVEDQLALHLILLEEVARRADQFDIIHWHVDYLHFPLSRRIRNPTVTTLHGRLDIPELIPLYQEYREMPVVSISHAQRSPLPHAHWVGTVHHGLPIDLHSFREGEGRYLAFLGRISPEKRVDRAIEIAGWTGLPIRIAAKVDAVDQAYFEAEVRPLLRLPLVEYLGEISEAEKCDFLGEARALLFPIDWREPFGLVMIEAMACGTPVIAWPEGSVPEVLEDGVTGFMVDDIEQAVAAVKRVGALSRRRCREEFERRFTSTRMALDYLGVYERLLSRGRPGRRAAPGPRRRSGPISGRPAVPS